MKNIRKRQLWTISILFLLVSIGTGCGRAKYELLQAPVAGSSYKEIKSTKVKVTSIEKGEKYDKLNKKYISIAKEILKKELTAAGLYKDNASATI